MPRPLIVFEMANNHGGSLEHGKKIVREFKKLCLYDRFDYAFKLQYRDLATFVHKAACGGGHPQVRRFMDTALSWDDFKALKDEITTQGFISICTPFDEVSVDMIQAHGYDMVKIASCSFADWPLLERAVQCDTPFILSTAGASLEEIGFVEDFFSNRAKQFSLLHCVGEYPTPPERAEVGQIGFLMRQYPHLRIGYSSHESPDDHLGASLAATLGALIFERHVGLPTANAPLNAYSLNPQQAANWLAALEKTYVMIGAVDRRRDIGEKEAADLEKLRRGVFAAEEIEVGGYLHTGNTYLAFPKAEGQLAANGLSKYTRYKAEKALKLDQAIMETDLDVRNVRHLCTVAHVKLLGIILDSGVTVAANSICELSHHYGIDRFFEWGAAIIEVINRLYCKKLLILLPGQRHPAHWHRKKEESFQVLYGEFEITVGGHSGLYRAGDIVHVEPGVIHSFSSTTGGIFEEISTTHYNNDSIYEDETINLNSGRKTRLTFWSRHLDKSDRQ